MKITPTSPEMNFNSKSIEKLLNDSAYKELIQISANFNTRLRVERKLRFPFLDPQTGVAQRHSNLYMKKAQRIPGLREGQMYTYPSVRWRNKRNSFLKLSNRPFYRFRANDNCTTAISSSSSSSLNPINHTTTTAVTSNSNGIPLADDNSQVTDFQAIIDESNSNITGDTDSNSQEVPKEWYYDDMDANDGVSEEQPDSDFDYNINGYKRKKKCPVKKTSRKPKDSFGMFGSESTEKPTTTRGKRSAGGSSNRSNRSNKKGTSTSSRASKSKNEKIKSSPPLIYDEPPSFDSVQGDLKFDGSSDSFAYRKY